MMIKRTLSHLNRRRRKGFTLIECVVSIAIFAILATMFASFMIDSVRVINLSIANDEDRELLLEAIAQAKANSYTSESGRKVTIETYLDSLEEGETKDTLTLTIDFGTEKQNVVLNDKYVIYTTDEGNKYCIYVGNANDEVTEPEFGSGSDTAGS